MAKQPSARARSLELLEAFVGEWTEQVELPDAPPGRVVFEWAVGGQFLVQRSEIPHPDVPDSLAIMAAAADGEGYTQHYFDSRGVVRVYAMGFSDGVWTLVRDAPDFTPLDFPQRFTGTFAEDGRTIEGAWETSPDGVNWQHDFALTYTRIT